MEELVIQAQKGNSEAYTQLIVSIQTDLYRNAQARLNNNEDIKDAIQETIITAYTKIGQLNEPKYFKTWIIKILINVCNNIYRKNYRNKNIFSKIIKNDTYNDIYHEKYSEVEDKIDLDKIISTLKYEERICIVLFYGSNYSIDEISDILNTNRNTIKSRITRAKKKIKKLYESGGGNDELSKK